MIVKFLCGCSHEIFSDTEDIGWWKEVSTDQQGFLVCVAHRQRRAGWNTLPSGAAKPLANWKFAGYSPLAMEQFLVYGKPLPEKTLKDVDFSIEDRRDNRDPVLVGNEILFKGNGHGASG